MAELPASGDLGRPAVPPPAEESRLGNPAGVLAAAAPAPELRCSDLFVATPGEAPQLAASDDPFVRWHSLSLKDVLELEWLALQRAARTDVFDEPLVEEPHAVVRPMTRHVVQRLAALEPEALTALAGAWQAEAFPAWPLEAVERVLVELQALAARARREGRAVLYLSK